MPCILELYAFSNENTEVWMGSKFENKQNTSYCSLIFGWLHPPNEGHAKLFSVT